MAKVEGFLPTFLTSMPRQSYREFYKWGNRDNFFSLANRRRLYEYIRDALGLSDEFFGEPNFALDNVNITKTNTALDAKDVEQLRGIVGDANVHLDIDRRIRASITKNMDELVSMHDSVLPPIVDAVVCPSSESEIESILAYAKKKKIAVSIMSSLLPKSTGKKSIVIDLTERFNKILEFSEVDSYVKVQAGMSLPILETIMNHAPENFKDYNVENAFTVGHFPLEYEECTVADALHYIYGIEAGYYGTFDDIVVAREYITDNGKVDEYVEGAILVSLTLRLVKYYPHNSYGFSYMFRSYQEAVNAMREIYTKCGSIPVHIRLSDATDTSMLMRYHMLDNSIADSLMRTFKAVDGERCLMIGFSGGAYTYSRLAYNITRKIAKKYKAISTTSFLADAYANNRYEEMYAIEALADYGIRTDRELVRVSWSELPDKYKELTERTGYVRSRLIAPTRNDVVLEIVTMSVG